MSRTWTPEISPHRRTLEHKVALWSSIAVLCQMRSLSAEERATEERLRMRVYTTGIFISRRYPAHLRTFLKNLDRDLPGPPGDFLDPMELVYRLRWKNSRRRLLYNPWRMSSIRRVRRVCEMPGIFQQTVPEFIIAALLRDIDIGFFGGALRNRVSPTNFDVKGPHGVHTRLRTQHCGPRLRWVDTFATSADEIRTESRSSWPPFARSALSCWENIAVGRPRRPRFDDPRHPLYSIFGTVQLALHTGGFDIFLGATPMW